METPEQRTARALLDSAERAAAIALPHPLQADALRRADANRKRRAREVGINTRDAQLGRTPMTRQIVYGGATPKVDPAAETLYRIAKEFVAAYELLHPTA